MSFIRNSLVASICTLMCRLTGIVRVKVIAYFFGGTDLTDAFYTAFRIPNLLRDLFAEGALSQSYTSVAAKVRQQNGDEAAWQLTHKIATQLAFLLLLIVMLGILFSGELMSMMYKGSPSAESMHLATDLCRIMWPFILFVSLSALTMGALNTVGVFGLPMLASAAFNIVTVVLGVAIGYWIDPSFGKGTLYAFAIAVVVGGLAQWAVQIPRLKKAGFHWRFNFHWKDNHVVRIWSLMLPSVVASGTTQVNVFINNIFALELAPGSVTALQNAFTLWQLPVGLFGVATGMVVLPAVSRMVQMGESKQIAVHISQALRLVAFFAVPSLVVLGALGEECISILYQGGKFDAQSVMMTGSVLASYAIGLLGYAGLKVVQPVVLALEKRWLPLIVSLITLCISLSLNYSFVRIWHKDASWLALTTSVVTTFSFVFYFIYIRRHLGSINGKYLLNGFLKIAGAGVIFALVCLLGKMWLFDGYLAESLMVRIGLLVSVTCVGGIAYLGMAWLLRVPELQAFVDKMMKRKPEAK